jgi:hypothetical protein
MNEYWYRIKKKRPWNNGICIYQLKLFFIKIYTMGYLSPHLAWMQATQVTQHWHIAIFCRNGLSHKLFHFIKARSISPTALTSMFVRYMFSRFYMRWNIMLLHANKSRFPYNSMHLRTSLKSATRTCFLDHYTARTQSINFLYATTSKSFPDTVTCTKCMSGK